MEFPYFAQEATETKKKALYINTTDKNSMYLELGAQTKLSSMQNTDFPNILFQVVKKIIRKFHFISTLISTDCSARILKIKSSF